MPWPREIAPGVERRRSPTTGMTGAWTASSRRDTRMGGQFSTGCHESNWMLRDRFLHAGGQDFLAGAGQELDQLVAVEAVEGAGVDVHDRVHQLALLGDHLVDLLLEGAARDQLEDLHAAGLAPAMDAVGRLVFPRRVPPAVVVDDDARRGEVDAHAARHQAADEDLAVVLRVELADRLGALARIAADLREPDPALPQVVLD